MAQYLVSLGVSLQLLWGIVIGMSLGLLTRFIEWLVT